MDAIILFNVAEYCDHSAKLTIKRKDKQIRVEIWSSGEEDISIQTVDYPSFKKAYATYKEKIGEAILGGWKVLNLHPQRETWETKRSK